MIWLQTSPFHSFSWKSCSIHYLCQAPCAVRAGRLYFEARLMTHTKCHATSEPRSNLFQFFKVWFFRHPKRYRLWIVQQFSFQLRTPKLGVNVLPLLPLLSFSPSFPFRNLYFLLQFALYSRSLKMHCDGSSVGITHSLSLFIIFCAAFLCIETINIFICTLFL